MSLSSQLNPHFIFNCLNTLQSMYLTKDFLKANEFMGNFSRLLRHTIEHLRKQNVTLKEEMAIVDLYVSLENAQQENVFNYQVMIDESIDTGVITLPAMLIQIFVENAIKHGLRSIPEVRGELVIQIVGTTKEVKITICDNGIGINKSLMTKKKTGISRGTELILEQVAIYNQVSSSKIYIDIKDRSEFSSESGTIVTITYLAPHDAK